MKRALALLLSLLLTIAPVMASARAEPTPPYPTLSSGATGAQVEQLQTRLRELSFLTGKADGIYGQQTTTAVREAQRYLINQGHSLTADGVAGPLTLALLYDDLVMREFLDLKNGSSGSKVTALQTQLYDFNLLSDRPDGAFGPRTEAALRQLQELMAQNGLPGVEVNGIADKATRDALAGDLSGLGIKAPMFFEDDSPQSLTPDFLYARSAILMDAQTGQVLFEKNADDSRYPASTTKIMTLLLALEAGSLDRQITVPQAAEEVPKDSSLVPVTPGEKMTLRDLLYGLMIRSGNDAANAIATILSGSVARFVDAMNEKARQLGLSQTHFKNPHGYHDKEHVTSARDLAALARHALSNNAFLSISASLEYTLPETSRRGPLLIKNTNEILLPDSPYYYPGAYGIKSGYTRAAGFCYVGAAGQGQRQLIAVVLDCRTRNMAWDDMKRLFNLGFAQ